MRVDSTSHLCCKKTTEYSSAPPANNPRRSVQSSRFVVNDYYTLTADSHEFVGMNQIYPVESGWDAARIQFRLPDGSTLTQQFDAKAPLQVALQFLQEKVGTSLREFTMSTTFPRRRFAASDMNSTFLELDLVPTAAVIVLPGRYSDVSSSTNSSSVKPDSSSGIIAMLLAPLVFLWNLIVNIIFGRPSQPGPGGAGSQVPVQQTVPPTHSSMGARPKSAQVRRRTTGGDSSTSRQEGNIHRLASAQDDNDENNTWNGNSTQQM